MVRNHPRFVEGLSVTLDTAEEVTLPVDEENMKQVFYNLAVNAIEAMGTSGQLEITLDGDVEKDIGRCARVIFRDDGEGMDEDALAHEFRPF